MIRKKEMIAMLLAGGQGSRLYALTNKTAKPAVSFGGKYRIIDFPLSNCINSGIDTVGVVTQYQPLMLSDYIGIGQPWDLDRAYGGVHILSPYQGKNTSDWYLGTANAVFQNIYFIKQYSPEYVIILSGDHIYKMDYSEMLEFHKATEADVTIATISVPIKEASRFGIVNIRDDKTIYEFEEKPKQPKSTLASMGIYIFTATKLYDYLNADATDKNSEHDFGKNILPKMLAEDCKMVSYEFDGYWKDVGTLHSLLEANLDLLGDKPALNIYDGKWKIFSKDPTAPPHYIGKNGRVINSIISTGCEIYGTVENSVLSSNVVVGEGAVVSDSVIMQQSVIGKSSTVCASIIDENVTVGNNCKIGAENDYLKQISVMGRDVKVEDGTIVLPGEIYD